MDIECSRHSPEGGALVAGISCPGCGAGGPADVGGVGGELLPVAEDHRHLERNDCRKKEILMNFLKHLLYSIHPGMVRIEKSLAPGIPNTIRDLMLRLSS